MTTTQEGALAEDGEKELTLSEVKKRLRLNKRMLYYRLSTGDLKGRRVGWQWFVKASEVEAAKDTEWYRTSKLTPA